MGVSGVEVEGEDEVEDDSRPNGARVVGSGVMACVREVVESARYVMGVLIIVCLLDCNRWANGKSLVLDRNAAVPIRLNSMILQND